MLRRHASLVVMITLAILSRRALAFHRLALTQHNSVRSSWRGHTKQHGRKRPGGGKKDKANVEGPFNYHDEIELLIEDLSNLGDGVAKVDLPRPLPLAGVEGAPPAKYVVMVPHVMVGERVKARVWANRGSHSLADLVEILEPSPLRVVPPCPLFGACGGCQYQFMPIGEQRRLKRSHVAGVLSRIGGFDAPAVLEVVGTDEVYGYRTKLTPHHDKPDPVTGAVGNIGFQRLGSRGMNLVDVEYCAIATPELNARLATLRHDVAARAAARAETDQARETNPDLTDFAKQSARRKVKGATLLLRHASSGGGAGGVVVTDSNAEVTEEVTGQQFALRFQFRAGEFFQNNPFVLPRLVDHVVSEARQPLKAAAAAASAGGKVATHLIDAYCGGGLFCLAAAAHFEQCAGIEISALNIASAQRNAALNGISNCAFVAGTAEDIFQRVTFDPAATVLVIDPPRAGCSAEFLDQLLAFKPARVVYVSCDPATQARDARVLFDGGYALGAATPFDLFPQTRHIESAITFDLISQVTAP